MTQNFYHRVRYGTKRAISDVRYLRNRINGICVAVQSNLIAVQNKKGSSYESLLIGDKLVCSSQRLSYQTLIGVVGMGHSGLEAITLYKSLRPDLLLMDIRMEQMSGLEAGEIILSQYEVQEFFI